MATDVSQLSSQMTAQIESMQRLMEQNLIYQQKITEITTYLGQMAARAAKQTPQG
jgi:NADH:ubiquinone oxidoreductase subunit D